jgi:transcriptional regulator with XRE-family HTH domain
MARSSAARERRIKQFGEHLRTWRRASSLPASLVAERAGITRDTLRALEDGSGTVKLENVFAVLEALGLDARVAESVNPLDDQRGRTLVQQGLPERVRQ